MIFIAKVGERAGGDGDDVGKRVSGGVGVGVRAGYGVGVNY